MNPRLLASGSESRGRGRLLVGLGLVGAGASAALAAYLVNRGRIAKKVADAAAALPAGTASEEITLRTTGYWPYDATPAEREMEGDPVGAAKWRGKAAIDPGTGKRPIIYTLEQHLAGKAPYVSLSGDPAVWPFGQRISMDAWPGAVFRYVDTGGHFTGAKKVFRILGDEPTDIAVDSSHTKVPTTVKARIISGDSFAAGAIEYGRLGHPVAGDYLEGEMDRLLRRTFRIG